MHDRKLVVRARAARHHRVRLERRHPGGDPHAEAHGDDPHLIAASLAAGAVGAGLTHLGCTPFAPGVRRPVRIAVTCVVGAVAGMLFFLGERRLIAEWWLYVLWQPAVAFAIGMALAARSGTPEPS